MGLKNARIQSIFQGVVPTADALEIIHRAEKVRTDWLLTGEGPPFQVANWLSDSQVAARLSGDRPERVELYLLMDGGRATLVTTEPTLREYEWGAVSRFTDVTVYPCIGQETMITLIRHGRIRVVRLDEKKLSEVSEGGRGPVHLLNGILDAGSFYEGAHAEDLIREAVGRYEVKPEDETQLLAHFRHLKDGEREAVMSVIRSMDRTSGDA